MITKRYRVVIDYEVAVEDWPDDALAKSGLNHSGNRAEIEDWQNRQMKLFEAIMKDPRRVDQVCQRALLDVIEGDLEDELGLDQFVVPEEDQLIFDAFKDLSPDDAKYWNEELQSESFYESSLLARAQFNPCMMKCTLQDLDTGTEIQRRSPSASQGYKHVLRHLEAFGSMEDLIDSEPVETIVRTEPRIGRNDYCPCRSGKKFKKCCGNVVAN